MSQSVWQARSINVLDADHPLVKIGRFEGIESRGSGGCGLVFEVRDPELDRHVALKLCLTSGPEAAAAIIREARMLAKLSHPNIITVYETGRHGDDVFFVMELIKGKKNSGNHLIHKQPRWQDAVRIYAAAGSGLAAAHDANIIHGDFKPGNILIDELCERPRVTDFGFARVLLEHAAEDERDELEFRIGTLPYMAPEVLRGQPGEHLSDQWSFCVSLWETLESLRPFKGESPRALLHAIGRAQPAMVHAADKVPTALRSVLRVGLSIDPRDRHEDMHTLVGALNELAKPGVLEREPTLVPGAKASAGQQSEQPRHGIFFLATVSAFAALLGSLASGVLQDVRHAGPDLAAPDSTPAQVSEVDEGEIALGETLRLIQAGSYEKANSEWESEVGRRGALARRSVDATLQVARAFVEAAESIEAIDPVAARVPGRHGHLWALVAVKHLRGIREDDTSAETLANQTRRFVAD